MYKVELCPDFIHRFFTFYTGRTLYTKPYTTGFGQGLEITQDSKQEIVLFKYMMTLYYLVQG